MKTNTEQFAGNLVPIKTLRDLRDATDDRVAEKQVQDHWLTKALKEKYDYLTNLYKEPRRSMIIAGTLNSLFIQGQQVLRINHYSGMPKIEPAGKQDPMRVQSINKLQRYCTEWQAKWKTSKPDILIDPMSNQDEAVAQVKKANAVADYLERSWFTNEFDLDEGLNVQAWGWYGRQIVNDYTDKSLFTFKEVLGKKSVPIGKAYGKCDCGYAGEKVEMQKVGKTELASCPECKSLEYDYEPPFMQEIETVVDKKKVFLPELKLKSLDFASTCWDIAVKLEKSSWMITEREVEEGAIRRSLGSIRFPEGESANEFGLDTLDFLSKRGAAFNGQSTVGHTKSQKIVLTEMYLSPEDIFDIRIGGEEKTVEGATLPKGKRMSEVFPDGCTVIGINGMSLVIGLFPGNHQDSTTSGTYHKKPNSGTGRGIDDARNIQTYFNRRFSQADAHLGARSTPPILMMENAIDKQYRARLNQPGAVIPVKLQNFPEVTNLNQIIAPLQGQNLPGDLLEVVFNRTEDMLQTAYHILNFSGGNPRADNKTATGAEILDANSDEIFTPVLSIKAECTLETVRKGFYKWCKNTPEPRFIPFKSKTGYGIEISGKDVEAEYYWSYVPGSEAPKNRYTENQKRMNFLGMFGGPLNYFTAKKEFAEDTRDLARDFDVNFHNDEGDPIAEGCQLRLNMGLDLLKQQTAQSQIMGILGAPVDYLSIIAQIQPKFVLKEPKIPSKIVWFQNVLDDAVGLQMKPEERELVAAFVEVLQKLQEGEAIEVQQSAARVQVEAQRPIIEAQRQEQAEQAAAQQEQQQGQMVAEGLQTLNQNAENEAARDAEQNKAEDEQSMRLLEMANQRDMQDKQHSHEQVQMMQQQSAQK